jgi:hypothetical protein
MVDTLTEAGYASNYGARINIRLTMGGRRPFSPSGAGMRGNRVGGGWRTACVVH